MRNRISVDRQIEDICGAFEATWKLGSSSIIEAHVATVANSETQKELFAKLLALDIRFRRTSGENVRPTEYESRFPRFRDEIQSVFASSMGWQDSAQTPTESFISDFNDTRSEHDFNATKPDYPNNSLTEAEVHRIGPYVVLNKIAEHGQGIVYRANHPELHRQVVIKVCNSKMEHNPQGLLDEASVLAQLNHPNVATVYDVKRDGTNRPYLVMEYIEGRNLADILTESRFSVTETIDLIVTICRGLQYAHDLGILHLDLKPANIVIRAADKVPKIIDFGLAQLRPAYGVGEVKSFGGTWRYMAPEQAAIAQSYRAGKENSRELDVRADVFSLGVILYEMLTGQAFRTPSLSNLQSAKSNTFDAKPLSKPGIPRSLRSVCLLAIATDPSMRIASAGELATLLESAGAASRSRRNLLITAVASASLFACLPVANAWLRNAPSKVAAVNSNPSPPTLASPVVQAADLSVELFIEPSEKEIARLGLVGGRNSTATKGQLARIFATLPGPHYCYLFALNPTEDPQWNLQLCYPETPDTLPALVSDLTYPREETAYFPLTDGVGQQAFVLITSPTPLKPFNTWKSAVGERLSWKVTGTRGVWKYQQSQVKPIFVDDRHERGQKKFIEPDQFAAAFRGLSQALANTDQEITAIAFPVLP